MFELVACDKACQPALLDLEGMGVGVLRLGIIKIENLARRWLISKNWWSILCFSLFFCWRLQRVFDYCMFLVVWHIRCVLFVIIIIIISIFSFIKLISLGRGILDRRLRIFWKKQINNKFYIKLLVNLAMLRHLSKCYRTIYKVNLILQGKIAIYDLRSKIITIIF